MPTYEYACDRCGTFEVSQRITDKPLRRCPTCKGRVRKLISSTSFQLKGSGWYVTDYAGKDGKKKGAEEGKSDSTAASSKESKDTSSTTETKPESKSDSKSDSKKTEAKGEASAA